MPQIYRFPWGVKEDAQVVILEYGSKSTPLIASICRELGVCTQTMHPSQFDGYQEQHTPRLVILSGGQDSVYDSDATPIPPRLMDLHRNHATALFGICYGAQALAHTLGGRVEKAVHPEIGITRLSLTHRHGSLGEYRGGDVVMNHGDEIVSLPFEWERWGSTEQSTFALFKKGKLLGTLFHPEMDHTTGGKELFSYVLFTLAQCTRDHTGGEEAFVAGAIDFIRTSVPRGKKIVVGVSGGVDSCVAFELCRLALGADRVVGIHVDNGFLREGESQEIRGFLGDSGMIYRDASGLFWDRTEAISWRGVRTEQYFDQVRKTIGETFIEIFEETVPSTDAVCAIAQGTNLADIQESATGFVRHHNVGGLPERMHLDVIEPLASLHKWQIRALAAFLGLHPEIIWRQPSPGPASAIRMWPPITRGKARIVGMANRVLEEEIRQHYPDPRYRPTQYYVALMSDEMRALFGDQKHYSCPLLVRAVKTGARENYASADIFYFPEDVWRSIESRLRAEVTMPDGTPIAAVFYHGSGKPPAPVECH